MKLFLDRNKTLLPRVDKIYLIARATILFSVVWLVFFSHYNIIEKNLFYIIIGIYTVHLTLFAFATFGKLDIKLAYFSMILFDLLFIPLVIMHTGNVQSSYFLLFFLTISVSAYVLRHIFSLIINSLVSIGYLLSIWTNVTVDSFLNIGLNIGFFWLFYIAIVYASEYMHKSEQRLLKLFNTLNMRTSELEKYQAHLEMIYENSRVLASILDTNSVISEVMRLLGNVLHYETYAVIFTDAEKNFYYRARHFDGKDNYHLKQIKHKDIPFLDSIVRQKNAAVINDISNRDDYTPIKENSHSVMIVPMVAHDFVNGILIAESAVVSFYSDKDVQILTAVARSAALALENAILHKKTEELTVRDELTDTFNYRHFVQKLEDEKRRASRYNLPLSLIMVDIDWFKKLNDTYGHESGNLVLKDLSKIIKQCIRDVDIFARYGGEEFAVILPQTPQRDAHIIGERIRKKVEEYIFNSEKGDQLSITVSVGLTSYPENGRSHEELVSLADEALYRAKGEGRNLVCVK